MADQKTYEVTAPDGRVFEMIGDHAPTEDDVKAAFAALPERKSESKPRERTWADTAVDALPAVGAIIGGIGGSPTMLGAAATGATGAALGATLKQGINKLRGVPVAETLPDLASEVGSEAAMGAVGGGVGAGMARAVPVLGQAAQATGDAMQGGADTLRALLAFGHGWKGQLAKLTIPPLMRTGGKALSKAGAAVAGPSAAEMTGTRLARIPIEARLAQIGTSSEQPLPKIAANIAQSLADDVSLIRESISKGMDPKVAVRIIANGSAEYAEALKDAYVASVKSGGLPPPEAVQKLMQLPSFSRLAK